MGQERHRFDLHKKEGIVSMSKSQQLEACQLVTVAKGRLKAAYMAMQVG